MFLFGAEQSAPKSNCKNRKFGLLVLDIDVQRWFNL